MTVLTTILGVVLTAVLAILAAAVAVKPDPNIPEEDNVRRAAIAALSVLAIAVAVAFVLAYRKAMLG